MVPVSQLRKLRHVFQWFGSLNVCGRIQCDTQGQVEVRIYKFTAGIQLWIIWININVGESLVPSHDCECSSYSVQTMTNGNVDLEGSCEEPTFKFFLQLQITCVYAGENPLRLPNAFYPSQKVTTLKWCIKSKWECKPEWFTQRTLSQANAEFGLSLTLCLTKMDFSLKGWI